MITPEFILESQPFDALPGKLGNIFIYQFIYLSISLSIHQPGKLGNPSIKLSFFLHSPFIALPGKLGNIFIY